MRCSSAFRVWIVLNLLAVSPSIAADNDSTVPSQKDAFHIYLLIGQSNMAGRGQIVAAENQPPARILKMDKQSRWVPATDPLHFDKPKIAGVGPGSGFGPAMAAADEKVTIGLVPCAFGGTPLKRWEKGGDLYQNAIKRAKAATARGTLKGVIWHQGESDSKSPETADSYGRRLRKMISDMRTELKSPELPFVVGKLGEFITAERLPHAKTVNDALGTIAEEVKMSACVETSGLKAKSDGIHFDADSARELGRRYAAAMLKLQGKSAKPTGDDRDATHFKLDDGIENDPDARYPVFVRFRQQLFKRGGDYEKFAETHQGHPRSKLRQMVLKTLRDQSATSWALVKARVAALEEEEQIQGREQYWIVNGFACLASGKACSALAELDEVEFVYLQKGNARQHRPRPRQGLAGNQQKRFRQVYEAVLKDWKDDSNDAFSAGGLEIPWNVARIQAEQVWTKEKVYGQGVVVGLIDSGLMVTPALTAALWKNSGEELNGKDDDGNGFVDDLFGYDFNADSFYALGDGARMTHGSMCGGIIAGRPINQKKLATGIAPRARLMMLRGMGKLRAYEYALANGADIISMSFMFTQPNLNNYRGVYRLAHEHLAAGGVLSVGGAGNFGPGGRPALPEGRQIAVPKDIPCVIAAAGITKSGSAPAFSSRGPCSWAGVKFYDDYGKDQPLRKPDVTGCIGGYPVWGRPITLGGRWKIISKETDTFALIEGPQGNSFSGPHAAGVAALMLSANPELNVWDIKSLMEKTCQDVGDAGWDPVYGAGLLQALTAVRAAKAVQPR